MTDVSAEDVWQHVSKQINDEFALLEEKAGEVSSALETVVQTATTPIDIQLEGYVNSSINGLAGRIPRPFGTTNGRSSPGGGWGGGLVGGPPGSLPSGGATGSAANSFVPYSQPSQYAWGFSSSEDGYYHPNYQDQPEFDGEEPDFPGYPQPAALGPVQAVPTPEFLPFPVFVEESGPVPSAPSLREVTLPDRPSATIPAFTGQRPSVQFDTLSIVFDFADQAYQSALLGALRQASGIWLAGAHPIMEGIWNTLEREALERGARIGGRQRDWARKDWPSRGWSPYQQQLEDRQDEARQWAQNALFNIWRDAAIEKGSFFVRSWRAAIEAGVALEQVFITQWDEANQRMLEAATALVDFANTTARLMVKEFAAQTKLFSADSSVRRAQIEAEEEKLTISKAEIEAEKLRGQIDANKIEAYEAQRLANDIIIDRYEARQQGWEAIESQNDALNEQFKGMVAALEEAIARYSSQWKVVRAKIGIEANRQEFENRLLQAFSSRIQAATMGTDGEKRKADVAIEQLASKMERAQLSLLKQRADIQNALAALAADTSDELVQRQRDRAEMSYIRANNQAEAILPQLAALDINEQQQNISQQLQFYGQKHNLAAQQGAIALNTSARSLSQLASAAFSTINVHMQASGSIGSSWNFEDVYVT